MVVYLVAYVGDGRFTNVHTLPHLVELCSCGQLINLGPYASNSPSPRPPDALWGLTVTPPARHTCLDTCITGPLVLKITTDQGAQSREALMAYSSQNSPQAYSSQHSPQPRTKDHWSIRLRARRPGGVPPAALVGAAVQAVLLALTASSLATGGRLFGCTTPSGTAPQPGTPAPAVVLRIVILVLPLVIGALR